MIQDKPSMVLPRHPDNPCSCTVGLWAIGFWKPTEEQHRASNLLRDILEFVNGGSFSSLIDPELPSPQDFVDPNWDPGERDAVIGYLRRGRELNRYMGYSSCRFKCGASGPEMGDADLTDGTFVWPEGFAHYLEKHAVRPPENFVNHVMVRIGRRRT